MRYGLGFVAFAVIVTIAAQAGLSSGPDVHAIDLLHRHAGPSAEHWLGTDHLGRDMFARVAAGGWNVLLAGTIASVIALGGGALLGLAAAFAPPTLRFVLLRCADLTLIVPQIIVAVLVVAVAGFSPWSVGVALGIGALGNYALMTEALAAGTLREPFVRAATALGARRRSIAWRHVLPAVAPQVMTYFAAEAGHTVVQYSALAFLGIGADTGQPDWGVMLFEYRFYLFDHPSLVLWPALAIFVLVAAVHLIFEPQPGVRRLARSLGRRPLAGDRQRQLAELPTP